MTNLDAPPPATPRPEEAHEQCIRIVRRYLQEAEHKPMEMLSVHASQIAKAIRASAALQKPKKEAARVRSPQLDQVIQTATRMVCDTATLRGRGDVAPCPFCKNPRRAFHEADCVTIAMCQALVELSAALKADDSERLRADLDDVVSAGSPSDLARIAELESELATLRSTHATLQSALRDLELENEELRGRAPLSNRSRWRFASAHRD